MAGKLLKEKNVLTKKKNMDKKKLFILNLKDVSKYLRDCYQSLHSCVSAVEMEDVVTRLET
jgi:hypothetical protein